MSRAKSDKLIDEELFFNLIEQVYVGLDKGEIELTQRNIIKILKPLGVANTTIARIINTLIATSKATGNSVQSQINSMKRKKLL